MRAQCRAEKASLHRERKISRRPPTLPKDCSFVASDRVLSSSSSNDKSSATAATGRADCNRDATRRFAAAPWSDGSRKKRNEALWTSLERLSQSNENAFRTTNVTEKVYIFVLNYLSNELSTMVLQ